MMPAPPSPAAPSGPPPAAPPSAGGPPMDKNRVKAMLVDAVAKLKRIAAQSGIDWAEVEGSTGKPAAPPTSGPPAVPPQ